MKSTKKNIYPIIYFILTALVLAYFFPREAKFKYQFNEGKPWRYDRLIATKNFLIYKTDNEIKAEQDSVEKRAMPYFQFDTGIKKTEVKQLQTDYLTLRLSQKVTLPYIQYIEKRLSEIYDLGILSTKHMEMLNNEKKEQINILKKNISETFNKNRLHTEKSAYETIIKEAPDWMDKEILKLCNINHYIKENLIYDEILSKKILTDQLNALSPSKGMVQAEERIIDRGDVVDKGTYDMLRSMKKIHEEKLGGKQRSIIIFAGQLVLIFSIMCCGILFFVSFRREIFQNKKDIFFILLCIFTFCFLTEICVKYELINIYIIPFAIAPIMIRTFFDSRTALFIHLLISLICSLAAPFPYEFLILQIIAGIVAIVGLRDLSQRSQLIHCSIFILIAYSLCYLSLALYQDGDFHKIHWLNFLYFGINFILLLFSYALVYILEKTFGYISPITLVELSNINNPLLKKLSETAPGTFQHSLQVSILASEAAAKVGADSQLIRTGAMYHDIGKMSNPAFFTENQNGRFNPHEKLNYEDSAQIIINHVIDGVKYAEKALLPQAIINFIKTHHGTGKVKYFYNQQKNNFPDIPIDEANFTYPGPNPFTKETAILMMADSVEAASRSLSEYTEESIRGLVNKIIDSQIADGLLNNSPLTFNNIETIKSTFINKLKTIYHTRISYPELKSKATS